MKKMKAYCRKRKLAAAAALLCTGLICFTSSGMETEEQLTESVSDTPDFSEETAIVINGEEFSLSHFNFYFQSWYDSFSSENSAMLPYMFDTSRSLKEQEYEEGMSWFDYFVNEASSSMQQIITLAREAGKAGYELTEEAQTEIDNVLDTVSGFAEMLGMNADEYLEYFYGKGMDTEGLAGCLTDARLADGYSREVREGFLPEEEEIENYYKEHIRDYTAVNYERYFARASEMGTVPSDEELEKAKALAEDIYEQVSKGTPLKEASEDFLDQGAYYSFDDAEYISGSVYGDWLFDPSRRDGDLYMVQDVNGWYVMEYHFRSEADYSTVNILDAYFPLDESKGSEDEQLEASCLEAEAFLDEWTNSGADEETFRSLAEKQAEISGSEHEYLMLAKGSFSKQPDEWAFDPERSAGDCSVLYSSDGFHVMYYLGEAEQAWKVLAAEDMKDAAFQSWFDDLMASSSIVRHDDVLEHAGGY